MNEAFTRKTGYRIQDTPTLRDWLKRVFPNPAYRKARVTEWKKGVFKKGPMLLPYVHEIRLLTKEGKWMEAACSTMRHKEFLVFCFNDITEDKAANSQLMSILELMPFPIAIEDGKDTKNPRILFRNQALRQTTGVPGQIPHRLKDVFQRAFPDPANRRKVYQNWLADAKECSRSGKSVSSEFTFYDQKGNPLQMIAHMVPFQELGIRVVSLVDISNKQKLIDALEREKEGMEKNRLELRERLRRSLSAGTIAHEIDTAMGAILLQSNLALSNLKKAPQANRSAIGAIQAILNQAEGVNLTIDRIRALISNMETRQQKVDLKAVVQSALFALRDRFRAEAIQVETRYPAKPVTIQGDETQLYLIIINLLRNAANALLRRRSAGRVIRVGLTTLRTGIQVVVENSGTGESARSIRRLAEWTIHKQGMGIGLFLVRSAVANHHGRVHFGTSRLKGWKVTVWLPVTPPQH